MALQGASFHTAFIIAAAATLLVEIMMVTVILRLQRQTIGFTRIAGVVLLANAVTLPSIWYIPYIFFPSVLSYEHAWSYTIAAEALVFIIEAFIYYFLLAGRRFWPAVALSALANSVSLGTGFFVGRFFIRWVMY